MRDPIASPGPIPCNNPSSAYPPGQSQWRWSAAIGQWNLVGCNCSGECVVPPGIPGTYDGQLQNMQCVACGPITDGAGIKSEDSA
jgi:hypothetical protein